MKAVNFENGRYTTTPSFFFEPMKPEIVEVVPTLLDRFGLS